MRNARWKTLVSGAGFISLAAVAGATWAGQPTQADMEFCNQKAAEMSQGTPVQPGVAGNQPGINAPAESANPATGQKASPVQPGSQGQTPPAPGNNPTGGRITDSSQPGAVAPGPATPTPRNNPTGGRITDSSQPGMTLSSPLPGMAEMGQTNGAYRQAYLTCLTQRSQ